jgi:hypothetical protein
VFVIELIYKAELELVSGRKIPREGEARQGAI